ncbi:MAG: DUF192 domain-containing protein [Patescibacteria group bacterium]
MFSRKVLILVLVGLVVLAIARAPIFETRQIKLELEIADDEAERVRGLSGRASLPADHGLLFIFDQPTRPGFWMKEMNFPIDIIWLDENRRVLALNELVSPASYPQTFFPPAPIKYVLEVNAGWAQRNKLKIGERADFIHRLDQK